MRRFRSPLKFIAATLLISCVSIAHGQAEGTVKRVPAISRMCLWNANEDTWKRLELDREQIARMKELREQYPAVVHGQWIMTPEMEAADRGQVPANNRLSVDAGPGLESVTSAAAGEKQHYLQADLRAVLSAKQLVLWKKICR